MSVLELAGLLRDSIGESDCELLRDAALAQPVNALTSFAYVVVGAIVMVAAYVRRRPMPASLVYGTCLVGVGLGSVLFHGPQPAGSRVLHDLPILLTVLFIVAQDVSLVWPRLRHPMVLFVCGATTATVLTLIDPNLAAAATGLGVGAIAVLELIVYRRRLRPATTRRQRQGYLAIIGVAAVGAATWLLGRTGSPVCAPDAAFQFHGLWHVVSAFVFGIWWWLAFDTGRTAGEPSTEPASTLGAAGVERDPARET
jgi:hypothetical protein